jgi:hypothetical protein
MICTSGAIAAAEAAEGVLSAESCHPGGSSAAAGEFAAAR